MQQYKNKKTMMTYIKMMVFSAIIIAMGFATGCQTQPVQETPDLSDTGSAQLMDVDFYAMFDYTAQETLHYEGAGEYYRTDTVERIDDIKSPETYRLYLVESNQEDMSDGESGDLSSLYQLKVSADSVSYYYKEGIETVLLKKPLAVGNTWDTERLDSQYGFMDITATIMAIEENGDIEVRYEAKTEDRSVNLFSKVQTFRFGATDGVVEVILGDNDTVVTQRLVKTASAPDSNYISHYVNPSETLKAFYRGDEMAFYVEDGTKKAWLWQSEHDDSSLYSAYEEYIAMLDSNDIRSVSRAKVMLNLFAEHAENDFELVERFTDFYEWMMGNFGVDLIIGESDDPITSIFEYYHYDDETGDLVLTAPSDQNSAEAAAVSRLLSSNGLGIYIAEGYPYFETMATYLDRNMPMTSDEIKTFIAFKKQQYSIFPVYSEGYLIQQPEVIADAMYLFETAAASYPNEPAFDDAAYYADYFFETLAVPLSFEMDGTKYYAGGYIQPDFYNTYHQYIEKYPKSKYTAIFKKIVVYLDSANGKYTEALNQYLNDLGYAADAEMIHEATQQQADFKAIERKATAAKPVRTNRVEVSDGISLIEAIAPDTEVVLKAGLYQIPYDNFENPYVSCEDGTLIIKDLSGLTIIAEGGIQADLVTDAYMEVIKLQSVSDIYFDNLRVGHIYAYCVGDVIAVKDGHDLHFDNMILYGCGYRGINLENTEDVHVTNSLISDCQASAIKLDHASNITIANTGLLRNGEQVLQFAATQDVHFENVTIRDNSYMMYEGQNGLFKIDDTSNIIFDNVAIFKMVDQPMIEGIGQIVDSDGNIIAEK
ncbi:right-handed parallel beta-helix repeat-containing protein [Fusibacter paucivorans]|uniref:Right-handed parallel beta-helix repeat-containing protein n=1 Tax=Fusibacter paucivorans TaxID=76009 RepID=A0ABS5PNZ1_9FIRM|nr:right-handed parallel beta-helix repeat-containing protein [Fusibacter paucivorans]MBS7526647.1 right-handed parallel beta-helix repeat-containing protein [Fusibacter paucivorans]